VGVPHSVQRNVGHLDRPHAGRPFLAERVGIPNLAVPVADHEHVVGGLAQAEPEPHLLLRLPVDAQFSHHRRRERNGAATMACLGRLEPQAMLPGLFQRLLDRELAGVEIHIAPAQATQALMAITATEDDCMIYWAKKRCSLGAEIPFMKVVGDLQLKLDSPHELMMFSSHPLSHEDYEVFIGVPQRELLALFEGFIEIQENELPDKLIPLVRREDEFEERFPAIVAKLRA
jgi:hypothetical protein